jgi:hypothetical protein
MVMNRFLGSLIYGNEESIRRIIAFLFNTAHFSRRFLIIVAFGPISGEFKTYLHRTAPISHPKFRTRNEH